MHMHTYRCKQFFNIIVLVILYESSMILRLA